MRRISKSKSVKKLTKSKKSKDKIKKEKADKVRKAPKSEPKKSKPKKEKSGLKKRSRLVRIKEKLIHRNNKADIVSCDPQKETVKVKVEETITNSQTGEKHVEQRTRNYSLSTKHGLSPKREGSKTGRLKKERKIEKPKEKTEKKDEKERQKQKRLKEREYRKKVETKHKALSRKFDPIKKGRKTGDIDKLIENEKENTLKILRTDKSVETEDRMWDVQGYLSEIKTALERNDKTRYQKNKSALDKIYKVEPVLERHLKETWEEE